MAKKIATIKELVANQFKKNKNTTYNVMLKLVLKHFPKSKFNEAHFRFYTNQCNIKKIPTKRRLVRSTVNRRYRTSK